ncbi:AMP-binding protein [Bacillus atrophaeus]|uniref:AMP-binding protein n=1 Tax=Bacillus atrophaeus TaxID=1452 RepID=UPI00227F5B60|nr:AMP-binding protein [Bacillus atrophaeus]MCY8814947.1 AMP-binding protein [Bacillus atrophaeus]MCY8823333.1 AMP-binding protein [Bacillus atrophaeus]MCY8831347.1 AMP-binding protein [Bacillus atrophaeus]MCY8834848.1 AMP-binding protein [Bacillus atrophaeus]MEC0752077.1 AMP-binding protein [Bacillus atrophaeus]
MDPGELYIGGSALARGYVNRPDLTAEKFIKHPFSNNENDRLYKTRDLVKWLSDRNLEIIGRIDR